MKFLFMAIALIVAFIFGAVGFPQIIGTIRFKNVCKAPKFTIILWLAILGFAAVAVFIWFKEYMFAFLIGYVISFLFSLNTNPD